MLVNPESTEKIIFTPQYLFSKLPRNQSLNLYFHIKILGNYVVGSWAYIILVHSHKTLWPLYTKSILKNTNSEKLWPISWSNRGQGSCAIKQIVAVGWYFFFANVQTQRLITWLNNYGVRRNPFGRHLNLIQRMMMRWSQKKRTWCFRYVARFTWPMHGVFVFETKIIIFLTNFTPFFSGKVFTHKKFLETLLYGLMPMLRFCQAK